MDCSTPGFPALHHLREFAHTYVHWVSDAIQRSHPLSSPSPPAFNLSQCQGLFQWIDSSYQVVEVLELQLQHHSFQWRLISFRIVWFDLAVKGTLFFSTTVWNLLVLSLLYCLTLTSIHDYWKDNSFDYIDLNRSYVLVNLWVFYSVSLICCLF